jgi:hypothetical protein
VREDELAPFRIDESVLFVFYEPRMLLRAPSGELLRTTKVMVRRTAPPFVAAVDREGRIDDGTVYNVVPASGLLPEVVAAVLNSRVLDFYLRRIAPLKEQPGVGSLLRGIDLEAVPMPVPPRRSQKALAEIVREIEFASLPGKPPEARRRLLTAMNAAVFDLCGFGPEEIERLSALHF